MLNRICKQPYYNFASQENNAKVISCSSHDSQCPPSNLLNKHTRSFWLSKGNTPQSVTFDLRTIIRRPNERRFELLGVYNRHSCELNPKRIELLASFNNKDFKSLGTFDVKQKAGIQLFPILQNNRDIAYMKVIIKEAHGRNRQCYINQLMLFDMKSAAIRSVEEEMEERLNENDNKHNASIDDKALAKALKTNRSQHSLYEVKDKKEAEMLQKGQEEGIKLNSKPENSFSSTIDSRDPVMQEQLYKISSILKQTHHDDPYYRSRAFLYQDDHQSNEESSLIPQARKSRKERDEDYHKQMLNKQLNDLDSVLKQMEQKSMFSSIKNRMERVEKKVNRIESDLYGKRPMCSKDAQGDDKRNCFNSKPSLMRSSSCSKSLSLHFKYDPSNFIDDLYDIVLKKDLDLLKEKAIHYPPL